MANELKIKIKENGNEEEVQVIGMTNEELEKLMQSKKDAGISLKTSSEKYAFVKKESDEWIAEVPEEQKSSEDISDDIGLDVLGGEFNLGGLSAQEKETELGTEDLVVVKDENDEKRICKSSFIYVPLSSFLGRVTGETTNAATKDIYDDLVQVKNTLFVLDKENKKNYKSALLHYNNNDFSIANMVNLESYNCSSLEEILKTQGKTLLSLSKTGIEIALEQIDKLDKTFSAAYQVKTLVKNLTTAVDRRSSTLLMKIGSMYEEIQNKINEVEQGNFTPETIEGLQRIINSITLLAGQFQDKAGNFNFDSLKNLSESMDISKIGELGQKIDEIKNTYTNLNEQINSAETRLNDIEDIIKKINPEKKSKGKVLTDDEKRDLRIQLNRLTEKVQDSASEIKETRNNFKSINESLIFLKDDINDLNLKINGMKTKLLEKDDAYERIAGIRTELMGNVKNFKDMILELAKDDNKLGAIKNLKEIVNQTTRRIDECINGFMGYFTQKFENKVIDVDEFSEKCEEIYNFLKVGFDILKIKDMYNLLKEGKEQEIISLNEKLEHLSVESKYAYERMEKILKELGKRKEKIEKTEASNPNLKEELQTKVNELNTLIEYLCSGKDVGLDERSSKLEIYSKIIEDMEAKMLELKNQEGKTRKKLERLDNSEVIPRYFNFKMKWDEFNKNADIFAETCSEELNEEDMKALSKKKIKEIMHAMKTALFKEFGENKIVVSDDLYMKFAENGFPEIILPHELLERAKEKGIKLVKINKTEKVPYGTKEIKNMEEIYVVSLSEPVYWDLKEGGSNLENLLGIAKDGDATILTRLKGLSSPYRTNEKMLSISDSYKGSKITYIIDPKTALKGESKDL